jgi:RNA polymerase sigma factor (sigma-70 family)
MSYLCAAAGNSATLWSGSEGIAPGVCHKVAEDERDAQLAGLMARAQDGEGAAYEMLLRACLPRIAAIARGEGLRGAAVDDAVQDTLLTLHRARHTYDPSRPFLPWLRAIARRRAVDCLRRDGRRQRQEVQDPIALADHPDPTGGAEAGILAGQRAARLQQAVASLPEGQREAVEHLSLREQSLQEAASVTGRSTGALKVNLHRALHSLRARLGGSGIDE